MAENPVRAVQLLAVLHMAVTGLSHVLQHRAWARFFERLHAAGSAGVLANGMLHFACGSVIVAFHPVWTGIPTLLTVLGYGVTLKGALYLCFPALGARSMARVSVERSRGFVPAGLLLLAIAGVLAYDLVRYRWM